MTPRPAGTSGALALTRDAFIKAGYALYGRHWRQRMADALRVYPSSISRWASGTVEVSGPASVAVELMLAARGLAPPPALPPAQ